MARRKSQRKSTKVSTISAPDWEAMAPASGFNATAAEVVAYSALTPGTWNGQNSAVAYEYDANGSLVRKTVTGTRPEVVNYTYDGNRRLVSAVSERTERGDHVVERLDYAYGFDGTRSQSVQTIEVNGAQVISSTNLLLVARFNPTGYSQVLEELAEKLRVVTKQVDNGLDLLRQNLELEQRPPQKQ